MGRLVEGQWVDEWYEPDEKGRFVRPETRFRGRVAADGSTDHAPEPGRYHLYVSYACPWAHRTLIMRALKGLDEAISVSVVHPHMFENGWTFDAFPGSSGDPIHSARHLHQVYTGADPRYSGRVTVPVLWDRKQATIVNNESREILRMLDHEFAGVARNDADYAPPKLRDRIEATLDQIYQPINNGVYRCGFATSQGAYDEALRELYAALDHWNDVLAGQRYLCGERITEADWCMFTTLVRFDAVYAVHFKCSIRRIVDYPHLWGYVRELFQVPGVRETVHFDHIREHYFASHRDINPTGIVAAQPALDFMAPHGRDHLARDPS